ncbi:MAG: ATP-binding protein [Gemmatimonadota bacterium]|nr:ATP-binding protein [Gemmatimonadota bacterium]MDE2678658.1 ATP-binding protein [Gemmatimonadota bacterium]
MEVNYEWDVSVDGDEPRRVAEQFESICLEHGVPMGVVFKFQLALDELLTNVVSYAFEPHTHDPVIKVMLHLTDNRITAVIRDNGRAFNPLLDAADPDLDLSAEERSIGGLGIHLTKAFVDELEYERRDGWNHLSLVQPTKAHLEENA